MLDVFGRERRARYTGGSGTQELTFVWTVEKGDNDPDGLEVQQLALNGATIRDSQDRDTEPETFPSARHKAYRVRGGLHAMWLVVTGSAREGAPFTVKVQRDGGFDELAHAIVRMTDSGMEDPAAGAGVGPEPRFQAHVLSLRCPFRRGRGPAVLGGHRDAAGRRRGGTRARSRCNCSPPTWATAGSATGTSRAIPSR